MEHVVDARLGEQRGIGVVEVAQQVLLDGGDVVDRLGHHPRNFLELGETVEFERVEFGMLGFGQHMARLHLRFGLNFDVAQLATQTDDAFRQVEQRTFQAAHFAFDARARNRQLAGFVDQAVEQIGAHA